MIGSYEIPEANLDKLYSAIDKLNKIADKLNVNEVNIIDSRISCTEFYVKDTTRDCETWLEESLIDYKNHIKLGKVRNYYTVVIDGETPKFNGWVFCATLMPFPTDSGVENQIRKVPGCKHDIPIEYRSRVGQCDYCNTTRTRKETYVVRNDNGEFKMVGSSCLKDFLGHIDPHNLANYLTLLIDIDSLCSVIDGTGRSVEYYDVQTVLEYTVATINEYGWLSKGKANQSGGFPTATIVDMLLNPQCLTKLEREKISKIELSDRCHEKAVETINWMRNINHDIDNDYLYNLSLLGHVSHITSKSIGLLCSAVAAYDTDCNKTKQVQKSYDSSEFIGEVGKREAMTLTVERIFIKETDFGTTRIHHMVDDKGNYIVWFASNNGLQEGETYNVKATVKNHNVYNNIKQTIVNRVTPVKDIK